MSAKRFLITFALAALLAATGCRGWCERNYPCPTPQYAGAPCCVPCGPVSGYQQAPVSNWNDPRPQAGPRIGRCVCD